MIKKSKDNEENFDVDTIWVIIINNQKISPKAAVSDLFLDLEFNFRAQKTSVRKKVVYWISNLN